ncbi:hypothetical protein IFM89_007844 [Coptis chinensis]|uniref:Uncharacterized protein n=1 Tax=Coptis chinensis TaxID=261450 RepID=A0A835GV60_9MAGN|nr:hypothetical protein IFM89_007844 [Coptis chinensis]
MEVGKKISAQSFPMNEGDGPYSYVKNSTMQREGANKTKDSINEVIAESLEIESFSASNSFTIADLGCSTGPNTFDAVQNILEAVELKFQKFQSRDISVPEFKVYFNDHVDNDFNTLFKSIPLNKSYFVAGVPGSFFGRLFPKASVHFVHSSYSLHWLSMVPTQLLDKSSSAWNKGRISYTNATKEVLEAYSAQFTKDMGSFLNTRAVEVVPGGLMALILLASEDENLPPKPTITVEVLVESCLMDMVKMGILSEAEVDSFNIPIYRTSRKEMELLIQKNQYFGIEKIEIMEFSLPVSEVFSNSIRCILEGVITKHFGSDVMDELFNRFTKKFEMARNSGFKADDMLVVLKRKLTC